MSYELIARDAAEQLRRWDANEVGRPIWSIEMGGLGPGYEQAIQTLAIEIVRDWLGKPLPEQINSQDLADATVDRIDKQLPNGRFSCGGFIGAQVSAAAWLAYQWLTRGPAELMAEPKYKHRRIQVSRVWPRAFDAKEQ